jgi:hypothetical protein
MGDGKKLGMDHSSWPLSVQQSIRPRSLPLEIVNMKESGSSPHEIFERLARDGWTEAEIDAAMIEAAEIFRREGDRLQQEAERYEAELLKRHQGRRH